MFRTKLVKLSAARLASLRQAAAALPTYRVDSRQAAPRAFCFSSCTAAHLAHWQHCQRQTPCVSGSAAAAGRQQPQQAGLHTSRLYSTGSGGTDGSTDSAPAAAPQPAPAASAASARTPPPPPPSPADIVDLPAKLALLEAELGCTQESALQRFSPFLCSPIHHISTRFAFLASKGKLRRLPLTPRLFEVICPSDDELCRIHGEKVEELAAFKQQHLASEAWRQFCATHGVRQAQPQQF